MLWMLKTYTVTLYHVITVYNDLFVHIDRVLLILANKNTQWKQDLYIPVEFASQMLSTYDT